jgi:AcrR family transcriptional regulator
MPDTNDKAKKSAVSLTQIKPRRGRRRAGEVSGKDAILRAALPAFATKGYDGVDLRGLAAEAHVNMALIGQAFGSKAKLWDAVIDNLAAEQVPLLPAIKSLCTARAPVEERLTNLIARFVKISEDKPYVHMLLMRESLNPGPRLDKLVSCLIAPFYMAVRPLLRAAISAKAVRVEDPMVLFFLMINTVATHGTNRNFMDVLAGITGENNPKTITATLISILLLPTNELNV